MRDSFVLYTKIDEVLASLTNEQKGILFQIIIDYEKNGNVPEIKDPVVKIAFIPIRQDLDMNNKKWEDEVNARKEAGRKGGLAKASNAKNNVAKSSKGKQKVAKVSNAKNNVANVADNEYEYEYVNENVNENDNIPPISPQGEWDYNKHSNLENTKHILNTGIYKDAELLKDHPDLWECIKKWMKYKDAKKPRTNNHYQDDISIGTLINTFIKHSQNSGEEAVIQIVDESIASNYQGILWNKLKEQPTKGTDWNNIK